MDPASVVEDAERTLFCPQTDRRVDGRTDKMKSVYPPYTWLGMGYIKAFGIITLIIMNAPVQITDLRGMQ